MTSTINTGFNLNTAFLPQSCLGISVAYTTFTAVTGNVVSTNIPARVSTTTVTTAYPFYFLQANNGANTATVATS